MDFLYESPFKYLYTLKTLKYHILNEPKPLSTKNKKHLEYLEEQIEEETKRLYKEACLSIN